MNPVPKRILVSSGALILLLLAINLWLRPNQALQTSPTSFGLMRDGYKAAFDLLNEMHLPVTRSFHRPNLMPTNQTVWLVAPSFLIADKPGAEDDAHELTQWVERGGTAVVFGEPGSNWIALGITHEGEKSDAERFLMKNQATGELRWLVTPHLLHFKDSSAKDPAVRAREHVILMANGKPFALEISMGKNHGRIVAIADSDFLRNENLGEGDASLVVADLARAYGAPVFDEHSHGLAPTSSLARAVLESRAILPILVGLLLAMLWAASQRVWPRRPLDNDLELPAPSIASFVESLSILYSRASDPAAVFHAYRSGFLRRLRRQLGVRADYPEDLLKERLACDRSLSAETRHWLLDAEVPGDQRDLLSAVRAIESYPRQARENRA